MTSTTTDAPNAYNPPGGVNTDVTGGIVVYSGIKAWFLKSWNRTLEALKCVSRDRWGQIAYYGALALLLVALGVASSAYRNRKSAPVARESAQTALSARAELPLPSPEPTVEPVRWVWPLEGEIVGEYSPNEPVWSATLELWQTHPGIDIAGSPGEAVYACRDGEVSDAWRDRLWGNVIVIDHDGGWRSVYRGVNTLNLVEVGQKVSAGDVISAVSPSMPCEADLPAHIHFELTKYGEPVAFAKVFAGED